MSLMNSFLEVPLRPFHTMKDVYKRQSIFRTIKSSDFRVVVDYREVAARRSEKCKLYLQNKPRGVGNVRMEMEQVDYLIEQ